MGYRGHRGREYLREGGDGNQLYKNPDGSVTSEKGGEENFTVSKETAERLGLTDTEETTGQKPSK
jgi:hypothetical protein